MRAMTICGLLAALATPAHAGQVRWTWQHPGTDIAEYRLYCGSTQGDYAPEPVAVFLGGNNNAGVTTLADGQTHHCVLTAVDDYGLESPPSSEVRVALLPPQAPTGLGAVRIRIDITVGQ